MKFDKKFAQEYIDKLLKKHKIKVYKWSTTSCGHAYWKRREIKIPKPTNIDRFGVCLHEIKHILDGNKGRRFEQEFYCDKYSLDILKELGWDHTDWESRMRWHSLSRIAMATNRGLDLNKIKPEIREFFKEINFSEWKNKQVFVKCRKATELGYIVKLSTKMSKEEIVMLLGRKGMWMERSGADDSTYGKWIVNSNGVKYGTEFDNLAAVVEYYKLA